MRSGRVGAAWLAVGILAAAAAVFLLSVTPARGQPDVTVSPTVVNLTEDGATDLYWVNLTWPTWALVNITITPDGQTVASPTVLVFGPGNWSAAQRVSVTAVDDAVAEGPHVGRITHAAASADLNYSGIAIPDVTANIQDNDVAGVTVVPGTLTLGEGGTGGAYAVTLASRPTGDVSVTIEGGGQLRLSPAVVNFTPADWNSPKGVAVSAVDDTTVEGAHTAIISHRASSADPNYDGIAIASVSVSIMDNDLASPPFELSEETLRRVATATGISLGVVLLGAAALSARIPSSAVLLARAEITPFDPAEYRKVPRKWGESVARGSRERVGAAKASVIASIRSGQESGPISGPKEGGAK